MATKMEKFFKNQVTELFINYGDQEAIIEYAINDICEEYIHLTPNDFYNNFEELVYKYALNGYVPEPRLSKKEKTYLIEEFKNINKKNTFSDIFDIIENMLIEHGK